MSKLLQDEETTDNDILTLLRNSKASTA